MKEMICSFITLMEIIGNVIGQISSLNCFNKIKIKSIPNHTKIKDPTQSQKNPLHTLDLILMKKRSLKHPNSKILISITLILLQSANIGNQ